MKTFVVLLLSVVLSVAAETDIEEFISSSRLFTESIYNEILLDNNDNILVSPFSVQTALALTQSGAVGKTAEEMKTALNLPQSEEEIESIYRSVLPTFGGQDYVLHTANKVYVEDGLVITDNFKKIATDVYQAAFENVEFAESAAAAEEINKWVAEETQDKIKDLLDSGELDENTKLVLVNAIYFQGNWSAPFDPALIRSATFFAPNEEVVQIQAMYQKSNRYDYYESQELDAKFLKMPFRGTDASLTIVLPNKREGIAVLEKQMDLVLTPPNYYQDYIEVTLPKFRIESTTKFVDILKNLGMRAAFSDQADFSGIAGRKGEILITETKQKTFIDFNEVGVESAAATAVIAGTPTEVTPSASRVFNADHPFVFYIQVNGIVLFEGRVLKPEY